MRIFSFSALIASLFILVTPASAVIDNNASANTLPTDFFLGELPLPQELALGEKWLCSEGERFIFDSQFNGIINRASPARIPLVYDSFGLEYDPVGGGVFIDYLRISYAKSPLGDMVVEQTIPAGPNGKQAISHPTRDVWNYLLCPGKLRSPLHLDSDLILANDFSLLLTTSIVSEREVAEQETLFLNFIGYNNALREALISYMFDDRDIDSPLSVAKRVYGDEFGLDCFGGDPCGFYESKLREHLNDETSIIEILQSEDFAAFGEEVSNNWIFRLVIPTLSENEFFAVIDRDDIFLPYNYGFK